MESANLNLKIKGHHSAILKRIAHHEISKSGFIPGLTDEAYAELLTLYDNGAHCTYHYDYSEDDIQDLGHLPWCSIGPEHTFAIDHLFMADFLESQKCFQLRVAITDVDDVVKRGSAIDHYACNNMSSIYTVAEMFPMLPERVFQDMASLNYLQTRKCFIIDIMIDMNGGLKSYKIYRGIVKNYFKFSYLDLSSWLISPDLELTDKINKIPGLEKSIRLQQQIANFLKQQHLNALTPEFAKSQKQFIFSDETLSEIKDGPLSLAHHITTEILSLADNITAHYLREKGFSSLRRLIRYPKNWNQIIDLAQRYGYHLPSSPRKEALISFLSEEKEKRPADFPFISLMVKKLLGKGEYVIESTTENYAGSFNLITDDTPYATFPNGHYPSIITGRILKAIIKGEHCPYRYEELLSLAQKFTQKENILYKVKRKIEKVAAAILLIPHIGKQFQAQCTWNSLKGTWVHIENPSIEGRLINMQERKNISLGDMLNVSLVRTDIDQGLIDFV